ncbi:hypothetical protein EUTSA_v10012159mg [Eutrema salsugineum]|uniref:Uncharacterized protein n=1 Tax=Eutrema salsugineum TaxID=72664 RepID=V4MHY5_EUTSA|nr:hypothetical protein EUTSA_v10012159mg [Eutrema salsugineum]
MRHKRSLGLCFSCDERYVPGYKCKTSQLLLMMGEDVEEDDGEEIFHDTDEPEITLQSLTGWDSPTTMHVEVLINHRYLIALIDSRATHNFISDKATNRLNLKLSPTTPFHVRIADGHPLWCRGAYQNTTMAAGGVAFTVDLYTLPLSGLDIVLGIQWLEQLGQTMCDWKAQSLKFKWAGAEVHLHGLKHQAISQAHIEEVACKAKLGQTCFAVTIHTKNDDVPELAVDMLHLIQKFDAVFQPPTQLPPSRDIEHHITLKEGVDPINVRLYRYAHFQKE